MNLKIQVDIDLDDFVESWGGDALPTVIRNEIKDEVIRAVKNSDQYKAIIQKKTDAMMEKLGFDF